ncbi:MAG: transporter substrate-binding domain-containing protein, partial [Candidatus Pacebacteria bacterium]|nr:transporter substrate-binding domain-containing protein [Candidatus Paceibacterota bacterium]
KLDCELAPVAWDGIIESLKTKKIDLIIGSMNSTPERAMQIDFSDKYYENNAYVVAAKKSSFTSKTDDLAGKTIGVQISTTFSTYAETHYKAKSKIKIYQTQDEELQDLIAGRIDAVVSDGVSLGDWLKGAGKDCCEFKGPVEPDTATLGTGISVGIRKDDKEMMTKINGAIKAIRENGTYQKISEKYNFGFDIYGS